MTPSKQRIELAAELCDLVSDTDLLSVFENTNFGASLPREIVADTLLKLAGGYSTGYTALTCCRELGLVNTKTQTLTKKGQRYLYLSCRAAADSAAWQIADKLAGAIQQALITRGGIRDEKVFLGSRCIIEPISEALAAYQEVKGGVE